MNKILLVFFLIYSPPQTKMIPVIKEFDGDHIRIAYYIDDKCEECLKEMKPCPIHLAKQKDEKSKIQWAEESFLEEVNDVFGYEVANKVKEKLKED